MSRRVLVLAYFFPPLQNSGTQRPTKFVKYLRDFGWEPEIVTAAPPADLPRDLSLLDEIPKDVAVHRVGLLNEQIAASAARLFGGRVGDGLSWRLRKWFRSPDSYALWGRPARRLCAEVLSRHRFDAVYATGYPWSVLDIGRRVARRAGLPFVADFRDVWTIDDPYRERPVSPREIALERRVVADAAAVISVSDVMTEGMRAFHQREPPVKFHTIWNGYDPEDVAAAEPGFPKRPGVFRVVYTGVWRPTYNPGILYEAAELVRKRSPDNAAHLEVVTAGFAPRITDGPRPHLIELGPLSHAGALALMKTADLLFSPLPPGSYQALAIPGKLFEYAAVGRPILCTAAPDGEVARFFRTVGGGVAVPLEVEAIARALEDACTEGRLNFPPVDSAALAQFQRRNLTQRLAQILEGVSHGGGRSD